MITKTKQIIIGIVTMLVVVIGISFPAYASNNLGVYATYAIAMDAKTGAILYDQRGNEQWYPASVTKLMTAILLEKYTKPGEIISSTPSALRQAPSNSEFILKPGEQLTRQDALHALLMISSNDVAEAIADKIAGNDKKFAKLMNVEAKKIGATHSHFVNPNGLFNANHYSTAYDLALITKKAMQYPQIMSVLETEKYTLHTSLRSVTIYNQNKILGQPDVVGGKMGYTTRSGNNLMEIFKKNDRVIIVVVMKTTLYKEYEDAQAVAGYAFSHLDPIKTITIKKGEQIKGEIFSQKTNFILTQGEQIVYNANNKKPQIKINVQLKGNIKTVQTGEIVGFADVYENGILQDEIPVKTERAFKSPGVIKIHYLLSVTLLGVILAYGITMVYYNRKKRIHR